MVSTMPDFQGKNTGNTKLLASRSPEKWTRLSIVRTLIDDDGLIDVLKRAVNLQEVEIDSELVSDRSMAAIVALPKLVSLFVRRGPRISNDGIAALNAATQLHELSLVETGLTDAGIEGFVNCRDLRALNLGRTPVTDVGIEKLKVLPRLRILKLDELTVAGYGLAELADHERFDLYAENCPITSDGLSAYLIRPRHVETLSLIGSEIDDTIMPKIASLPILYDLRLSNTSVTDNGVQELLGHPRLGYIYLEGTGVSAEMAEKLRSASPKKLTIYR